MSSGPPYHRSTSYDRSYNKSYEDSLRYDKPTNDRQSRLQHQEPTSQIHYTYTSNCGRRRWPPSPKVEEVKVEEEIPMRGKIGQNPMIIDVPCAASSDSGSVESRDSDDTSGSETPPSSGSDNRDRRYVWKPEPDVPIPQAYDSPRGSKLKEKKSTIRNAESERGRKAVPKLDTDVGRTKSTGQPLPPLERERSPYASVPQDRKPKADRFSGEYLLSPATMTPRKHYAENPRSHSYYLPHPSVDLGSNKQGLEREIPRQPTRPLVETHHAHSYSSPRPVEVRETRNNALDRDDVKRSPRPIDRRTSDLPHPSGSPPSSRRAVEEASHVKYPVRPTTNRRVSDLPCPASSPAVGGSRQRLGCEAIDEYDTYQARSKPLTASPQSSTQHTPITHKDERHHNRRVSSDLTGPFSKQSLPKPGHHGPPVNLSSLVSGAAINQTLNATIKGDHVAGRRASPRPSPAVSPLASPLASPHGSAKTSPYSSPPRTPPSETFQHRTNPVSGLKKDPPSSQPSSPLSSRSSTWTMESDDVVHESDHGGHSRPATLKSRRTAPLPAPGFGTSKASELLASPGIVVRSPSPAKHNKSHSVESDGIHRFGDSPADRTSEHSHGTSVLRPRGSLGRQRSASSVDVRPQLHIQASNSSSSTGHKSGFAPSPASPTGSYKHSNLEPVSYTNQPRSSQPETLSTSVRHRSKSRSYVPESAPNHPIERSSTVVPTASGTRSRSTVPIPMSSHDRSRSSAPKRTTHALIPISPARLPKCPRPNPVAGYNDWYTLDQNTIFVTCPSCRDSVFSSLDWGNVQPLSVASSLKVHCGLNSPWIRLALTLRGPDVSLLSSLSDVTSKERSCPQMELAPRDWYRLADPESGKHVSGFNACSHCVRSLQTLFPEWKNVFYRSGSSHPKDLKERFCALRSSNLRFGEYLNMIVESVQEAESKGKSPNTKPVCALAKQLAAIDVCPEDKMFPKKAWHIHPHLPEFTICPECYENVVYPMVRDGSTLAAKIDQKPHVFPNPKVEACCHLYSPRMRKVLREACEDDDYEHLRHTVLKRHMLQQDMLATLQELQDHPKDEEVRQRLEDLMAKWKERV